MHRLGFADFKGALTDQIASGATAKVGSRVPEGAGAAPDIILHHYPRCLFVETVRPALGLKQLAYHAVTISAWMPKPDLMPLAGGCHHLPVTQVGADICCGP